MARVVLENLSKTFKGPKGESIRAVSNASFTADDKELLVLVGPSGCGKSTTLRMVAGLEDPTSGTIAIDGHLMNDVKPKDRDVAMVFQNYALYPHMTAFENIAFGLKLRKFPRSEIEQRVRGTAEILGLRPCLERLPCALSGGERQRVAIGRAIVRQPKVFLFDEPLSNLDAQTRMQMRSEIVRLHERLGTTMIYVTHDQVEAITLGHRIVVMKEGAVQQIARPLTLYREPANLFVAGFIGSPPMNFFRGRLFCKGYTLFFRESHPASEADAPGLRVPDEATSKLTRWIDREIILGLRPEEISLCSGTLENAMQAAIEMVEPVGAETNLYFTTGAHQACARVPSSVDVAPKQKVSLVFHMSKARFFNPATGESLSA